MSEYLNSTQHNKWTISKEKIKESIHSKYARAIQILANIQSLKEVKVRVDQEPVIIRHFVGIIIKTCDQHKFTDTLKAHVITYFKRFFHKKVIVDFDCLFVLTASFFLGFKVCEMDVKIYKMKELFKHLNQIGTDGKANDEKLLEYEFYLLDVLGYELHVYSPYKALRGFIYKLYLTFFQYLSEDKYSEFEELIFNPISKIVDTSYLSDCHFYFTYSYIALFSLVYYSKQSSNEHDSNNSLINSGELKNRINEFYDSIVGENKEKFSKMYSDFESEIKSVLSNTADSQLHQNMSKYNAFMANYKEYHDVLEKKREDYVNKLVKFSSVFEDLEKNLTQKNDDEYIKQKRK